MDAVKIIDSANNPNAKYAICLKNDGEAYYTTANNTLGAMTFPSKAAEITICGDYDSSEVNPQTIDSVRPQLVFTGSPSAKTADPAPTAAASVRISAVRRITLLLFFFIVPDSFHGFLLPFYTGIRYLSRMNDKKDCIAAVL